MPAKQSFVVLLGAFWFQNSHCFKDSNSLPRMSARRSSRENRSGSTVTLPLRSTVEDIYTEVLEKHNVELQRGFNIFGKTTEKYKVNDWSDDDFDIFSVGIGNAGPHENSLLRGSEIFRTKNPVISENECQDLIEEARQVISEGLSRDRNEGDESTRGQERTNSELNEAKISDLPRGKVWLDNFLQTKLFPMLESRFGVDARSLTLNDALILGYIGPSKSQPIHRDASLLSLQVALSPFSNYTEGGTFFEGLDNPVKMDQGHVLCHSSGSMHAGRGVNTGERWILVLFVISESEPQLARLCHREGVDAMDKGDLVRSELCFNAGLEVAPEDHLLRMSLAACYSRQNYLSKARQQLQLAQSYELCSKACLTHAKELLSASRPRAALRHLDLALERIGDKDLLPGAWTPLRAMAWEIRVQAGRCACLCAEKEASTMGVIGDNSPSDFRPFTQRHLPVAIERLRMALAAAPGHGPLQSMLNRAEELLNGAKMI